MADNFVTNAGSGGDTFGADDIGGVKYARTKVIIGADGINDGDVSSANPLPVGAAQSGVWNVTNVSGTVSLPTGAATIAEQQSQTTHLATIAGAVAGTEMQVDVLTMPTVTVTGTVGVSGVVEIANDAGNPIPINGTVTANLGSIADVATQTTLAAINAKITACNTAGVVVSSSALPSGAATESTLGTLSGKITACNTGAVAGSVTANAGTNLNTSALALETGGNLAAAATSLATLDNCIAGNEAQVDVVTLPALAAGTNLIGSVAAGLSTSAILNGVTALTPKYANVSAASSGDNAIVALVGGKKIRVLAMSLIGSGTAVSVYLSSANSAGTKLYGDGTNKVVIDKAGTTGPSGFVLGFNPVGWFETASGEALNLNLSAAQAVVGSVCYVEV